VSVEERSTLLDRISRGANVGLSRPERERLARLLDLTMIGIQRLRAGQYGETFRATCMEAEEFVAALSVSIEPERRS